MGCFMRFNKKICIGEKVITPNSDTFIIAEAGVNHGGDMEMAKALIDAASVAGADAVKFQSFSAKHLILSDVEKAPYQKETTSSSETQFEMLQKLEVSKKQNLDLKAYCEKKNIIFLTTPFDAYSLNELDDVGLLAYKVASTDATNLPFLIKLAKKGKPIFLSTGMSYLSEVESVLRVIHKYNENIVLLQCTANYPIKDDEANLAVLNTYKEKFDILVGYSDHTVGLGAAAFSIPMGAVVVEKHFTLDKSLNGPDHRASLTADELVQFVRLVRQVDQFMGSEIKKPSLSELQTRASLQKCLVASKPIARGERFSDINITSKRTGGVGISPIYYNDIINRDSARDYKVDEIIEL